MATTIRIRFSGRFVLAQRVAKGTSSQELAALAMKMRSDTRKNQHRPLMAINRDNLVENPDGTPPDALLATVGPTANDPVESVVWDLTGWNVSIGDGVDAFTWDSTGPRFPNLTTIEKEQRHNQVSFDPQHVRANTAATTSTIRVTAGTATSPLISRKEYGFAPIDDPAHDVLQGQRYADFMDVTIPKSKIDIQFVNRRNPRMRRLLQVQVPLIGQRSEAVIRFSNLCPSAEPSRIDREFADYYAVFKHQRRKDVLVAKESGSFGGPGYHCFLMLYTSYE